MAELRYSHSARSNLDSYNLEDYLSAIGSLFDATLVRRLEKADPNWKTRVNDILRKTLAAP